MLTVAVKKLRDVLAYCLLGVAALYFVSGVSLLFKSEQDSGASFASRAAAFGYLFSHPILVISLAVAVALAVGFAEPSRTARIVVPAALVIGGLSLLFAVISWFSGFGADEAQLGPLFGGVLGAGKIVGVLLGLAQLAFLALAVVFAFTALQALPTVSRASRQWGQHPGYGPQQGYPGQGYGQPQQPAGYPPGWGQADQWYAQQHPGEQQAWGQPHPGEQQVWGQPPGEQQSWGQPPGEQQSWGEQQPGEQQAWGQQQPGEQRSWVEPRAWGQQPGEQRAWGQQPPGEQRSWGEPPAWGQHFGPPAQQWGDQADGSQTPGREEVADQEVASTSPPWADPGEPAQPDSPSWGQPGPPAHPDTPSWGHPDDEEPEPLDSGRGEISGNEPAPGQPQAPPPAGAHPAPEHDQ